MERWGLIFALALAATACGGSDDQAGATSVELLACEIACSCNTPCQIFYERWTSLGPELWASGLDPTAERCEALLVETRQDSDPSSLELFDTAECLEALDAATCTDADWGPEAARRGLSLPHVCYSRERPPAD